MKLSKFNRFNAVLTIATVCAGACISTNATPLATTATGTQQTVSEQSAKKSAEELMKQLKQTITKAEKKKICTLKERTALRTAEIFMGYADWDEANLDTNVKHFSLVARYKKEAEKYAKLLPDFERNDIAAMMQKSINDLNDVMSGKVKRLNTPSVDWKKVNVKGDELVYGGKPVFLADWTWKPRVDKYTEFHGNEDGFLINPAHVINDKGDVSPKIIKQLEDKPDGSIGHIFINHTNFPKWAKAKDPSVVKGPGLKYIMYDICNPLSRQIDKDLIHATVPLMAGKKYTQLGYMLCNEPHWNCTAKTWASAPISEHAFAQFKVWLKNKHKNIDDLNKVWNTSFKSFDDVEAPRIMTADKQGTPLYFDFMSFNMDRVTDWFSFLQREIKECDPQAKTHIKVMPNLWSDNKRDSGIDMEALTRNSDIIGNDASSCGAWMWGKPKVWEKNYSFDWAELMMAQDFFKSVSPEKIMYNTECHFLTTGKYRDLYQTPEYVRCNYWLGTIHGLTASQTWYWCRREDGSSRENEDSNGYAGSNNHQPRVVNEVHATIADLNSVSDVIMQFQRQRKPIRLFYTKASSINKVDHMDDICSLYENVNFRGTPIGFATENILNTNKCDWDAVLVYKTPYATTGDVKALQSYLNNGGTVIIDDKSLLTDEYGRSLATTLKAGKGSIIKVSSLSDYTDAAFKVLAKNNDMPAVTVSQQGATAQPACEWRVVKLAADEYALNIVNIGKGSVKLNIAGANGKKLTSATDMLTGVSVSQSLELPIYGVKLLRIKL